VPHQIIWSWYTGRRRVGCYIWYSEEATRRGPSPSRPLLAVPNVTAHPSTARVPITVLLSRPLLCGFNVGKALTEVCDKLQRVLNAAARLVSGTRKFDRGLSRRLALAGRSRTCAVQARRNSAPVSATQSPAVPDYCVTSASDIASWQRLSSASRPTGSRNFLCRVTNSAHLVVGPSLSLYQLVIRCRLTSVIRRVVTSLSDVHLSIYLYIVRHLYIDIASHSLLFVVANPSVVCLWRSCVLLEELSFSPRQYFCTI